MPLLPHVGELGAAVVHLVELGHVASDEKLEGELDACSSRGISPRRGERRSSAPIAPWAP